MDQVKQNLQNQIDEISAKIEQAKSEKDLEQNEEMKSLYSEEIIRLEQNKKSLEDSIEALEQAQSESEAEKSVDVNIDPNVAILEVRAGTGGLEASLFAHDLYRMYTRYAEIKGWKTELLNFSESEAGGIKIATIQFTGKGAFFLLQHESGVHRVQRVPSTESSGRIHTSAATVAVLPKVKKIDVEIKSEDIRMDFYRASGSGGQNVNKVSTAVRLTHVPTGVVVECQEERTQGKNREKAMQILESRIYQMMKEQQVQEISELRSEQVGSGDRSEKIRTYNFPQDRITDHRIGKNWHNIESIMAGGIEKLLKDVVTGMKELDSSS